MSLLQLPRIVFLFAPGPIGGAEKVVAAGFMALKKENNDVALWLIQEERKPHLTESFLELLDPYVDYKLFKSKSPFDLSLLFNLKKAFKEDQPHLIHAHGLKATFYGKLCHLRPSRFIVTHHGKTSLNLKVKFYEFLEEFVMRRSHAVVAVSEKMRKELKEKDVSPKRIHLVENMLSLEISERKKCSTGETRFVFIGRLSPEKGCDVLVEAISQVDPKLNFSLTIVGEGPQRALIQNLLVQYQLEGKIRLVGFQQDVSDFLASADCLIMPSLREGQPLSLIEACCSGIPVIGSRIGGLPELIDHGENGLLVEPQNSKALAGAIEKFCQEEVKLSLGAEKRKDAFMNRFSSGQWAKQISEVYASVLTQS